VSIDVHSFAVWFSGYKSHCETYQGKEVCTAVITKSSCASWCIHNSQTLSVSWYVCAESFERHIWLFYWWQ